VFMDARRTAIRSEYLRRIALRGIGRINATTTTGERMMRTGVFGRTAILLSCLLLGSQRVLAETVSGSNALAVASLVAASSPVVPLSNKNVMARIFDGQFNIVIPPDRTISIVADTIVCSASDVDITAHSCTLTFGPALSFLIGPAIAYLNGRKAHELYATMVEAGVPSEGSAGAVQEKLSHLVCTIIPHEIAKKGGGGAKCTFDVGEVSGAKSGP
jgi:hypothetical protein